MKRILILLALLAHLCGHARAAARPNVLFLVLEDVSPGRFATYGNTVCKTPNIDRLAGQGMRFEQFHTTPPCCPSRTSMMTGLRPETTKVYDNSDARLNRELFPRVTLLPEQFLKAGYETLRIGKFAHDDVKKEIWSRIVFAGAGGDDDDKPKKGAEKPKGKPPQGPHAREGARFSGAPFLYGPTGLKDNEHGDYQAAGAAIKVIAEKHDRPWFLTVGFHADHLPFRAPDRFFAMYPPGEMVIPQNPDAKPDGLPTAKTLNRIRKESGFNATGFNNPATLEQWREAIAAQYACLTFVDEQIGRVLEALQKSGAENDTMVILWSDHGFMLGEHFFWRKGQLYDTSTKCALVVRAPGVTQPGSVCRRVVESVDLYPSLLELCGLPAAAHVEAASFVPLLKNPELPWKTGSLIYREKGQAVGLVTERWRYNRFADHPERDELFDHESDAAENHNLIADPQSAAVVQQLGQLIDAGWKGNLPPSR